MPIFLNGDMTKEAAQIKLKGESAFPRILFDRREVLLPIVPLNVESKCTFRVINDGYQSANLSANVVDDFGVIPLTLTMVDGGN